MTNDMNAPDPSDPRVKVADRACAVLRAGLDKHLGADRYDFLIAVYSPVDHRTVVATSVDASEVHSFIMHIARTSGALDLDCDPDNIERSH